MVRFFPKQRQLAVLVLGIATFAISGPSEADQLAELTRPIPGRPNRASSGLFDPESNRDAHHVRAGQRFLLADLEGPGEIRHLWFTIASRDRRYPRNLMLRVFYDGSQTPSVETPIGDFFAAGNGMRANVSTMPIEVSSYGRALNSYWRMPFGKRCQIEVHNQGPETMTVYFHCDWLKLDSIPDDIYYFHARYRQEYPAKPFSWYTIFEGEGEGHYVGTVFSSQNNLASWFGETDDRFYIDGEEVPSIVGTGTEDYFNDAWNLRLTSNLRVGTTICEPKGLERRITAYRWHIDDPIPFKRSLKVELERRSYVAVEDPKTGKMITYDFKYRPDDWSSVAFWYQRGIARILWSIPPAEARRLPEVWIEPSEMVDRARASEGMQPRRASNRTCNLKRYFYMRNDDIGSWVEFPVTIPNAGRYAVSVFQNLFKHHGVWKMTLQGTRSETIFSPGLDFWDYRLPQTENWPENFEHGTTLETKVGVHWIEPGDYWVRFECVGANPLTEHPETGAFGQGRSIGLDAICFRRLPIDDPYQWMQQYLEKEEALFAGYLAEATESVTILSRAVQQYHKDKGKYPDQLSDLAGTPYWSRDRIPLDPWQQPYHYRVPGIVHPWGFDLWSSHGCQRHPNGWIGNWKTPLSLLNESAEKDIVLEGEELHFVRASPGIKASPQPISTDNTAPSSNRKQLFIQLQKPGDRLDIGLPDSIPAGRYEVALFVITSWDYGICRWSFGGVPRTEPIDGHTQTIGMKSVPAGQVTLPEGTKILTVEAVGKSGYSTGYYAGLDAIVLRPVYSD
ncbi:MAG: DUF2961 domain-containing protein [Pirellulales bacterium]|nr:DUF2961 domain-containing protein [Pirellulales bacterium]